MCSGEEKVIYSMRSFDWRRCELDCDSGKMKEDKIFGKKEKTKGKKNRNEMDQIVEQWREEKKRMGKKQVKK